MSLSDPLVLKNAALADVTFGVQSVISNTGSNPSTGTIRVDAASSAAEPRLLTIKQQVTGKGTTRVRRTLLQYTYEKVGTTGLSSKLTLNHSWVFPLNGSFTNSDLYDALIVLADLVLTTGSLAVDTAKASALLQGQS